MPVWMDEYLALLRRVLDEGVDRQDRTGTGTRSVFGHQMRFDLRESLPAVTTKRLHWPSIIHELLWFISGETTLRYLKENASYPAGHAHEGQIMGSTSEFYGSNQLRILADPASWRGFELPSGGGISPEEALQILDSVFPHRSLLEAGEKPQAFMEK